MLIREIMTMGPRSCSTSDPLDHAARLMWDLDIGALPVVDDRGSVIGMITDRDICMATYLRGSAPHELRVESAMARNVVTCRLDDSPGVVRQLMADHQVRRIPVVDSDGKLRGIVSLADLALEADQARAMAVAELRPGDVAHVLAAISAPRTPRKSRRARVA